MAVKASATAPLKVYVLWHKDFEKGVDYAERIYFEFCRKQDDYVGDSIGIPVYFENQPTLNIEAAISNIENAVFVLLVDGKMGGDPQWQAFAEQLVDYADRDNKVKFYPVAPNSVNVINYFSKKVAEFNYIRLKGDKIDSETDQTKAFERKCWILLFELAHEIARLLYSRERISENNYNANAAIKVFLSHARVDGNKYAEEFNSLIANTPLDSFIDVCDVARGKRINDEIDNNIDSSALLIIYTDSYSSREWCQHEVLYAKSKGRPIVLVDALTNGELRRFPYVANVRTIHLGHEFADDKKKYNILYAILLESLKVKYTQLYLRYLVSLYNLEKDTTIFEYPPELATLLMNKSKNSNMKTVLYPEPPLNKNEMTLIKQLAPETNFVTPTFVSALKNEYKELKLSNVNIGISISNIVNTPKGAKTNLHLSMVYIELCRYLLAMDANLIYGGNINYAKEPNFVNILKNLIANYCFDSGTKGRITNLHTSDIIIDDETRFKAAPYIKFEVAELTEPNQSEQQKLSQYRAVLNERSNVRIAMGGKMSGSSKKIPGVIEETYIAMKSGKPVFILGAYGGAAEYIVQCLEAKNEFISNLSEIAGFFNERGYAGLSNGLSEEENKKLSHSVDVAETISLILKGLYKVTKSAR